MTDLAPDPSHASLKDRVAHQTAGLIRLLESINYPYEISSHDLHTALTRHYLRHQHDAGSLGDLEASPTSKFLDWLIANVSAESNWPGYQHQHPLLQGADIQEDGMDDNQDDLDLEALNQEHGQLQNTLSSLEKELADLKTLETHIINANKDLDTDIHHASVQLDATASKLAETARTTLSEYIVPEHHPSLGQDTMDMDTDRDPTLPTSSSSSKRFLYQCQKELLQIQKLDMEYLTTIDLLLQQLLHHVNLSSNDPSSEGSTFLHLDQLLKRDPAQDQELVRLCSTYRATKMSHIRATAQLKCLEEELQYMMALDANHQELEEGNRMADGIDQDRTIDYNMYRNQQIQQTRQQEIELISVQRETARLTEEMDQLLSDPSPPPPSSSSSPVAVERSKGLRGSRGGLNSSWGSTTGSLTGKTNTSHETLMETGTNDGVLVDICERIARNDIELRFLSAAHGDYIREQEQTIEGLDVIVDQLSEYYSLGMTVEQTLALEKDTVQVHKGLLEAAVQEYQEIKERSRRLHELGKSIRPTSWTRSDTERSLPTQGGIELAEQLKQHDDLMMQALQERQTLQENIRQVASVANLFKHELLHRYSSTEEVHSTPRAVHDIKDSLVKRVQELQQGYVTLSDQVQEIIQQKSTPSNLK